MAEFVVGTRVQSVDNFRGTVRYFGTVSGANPPDGWVGVEWDTAGRGKHDGSFQGARYFSCADGRGSFVRPEMLQNPVTFQDALINKYASAEAANAAETMSFREAGKKKAAVVCELVGKDRELTRMAKLELLKEVTLPSALISDVGDGAWLKENVSGITSLELEDNLLRDWTTVAALASQLPNLNSFALSGNRLEPLLATPSSAAPFVDAFLNVRRLVLNSTGANFQQLDLIKTFLPKLTDLHMASNHISSIECGDSSFASSFAGWPSLETIDLSDNNISTWDEVAKLSLFTGLQRLILNGNTIQHITIVLPADTSAGAPTISATSAFGSLAVLALANNKLQGWADVRQLRHLQRLTELRVQGNPFCEGTGPSVTRQLLIAVVPSVQTLNGGEIRPRERTEAEKFYIRHTLAQQPGVMPDTAAVHDPILAALLERHGPPEDAGRTGGGAAGAGGAGSMVAVRLRSMAAESSHKAAATRRLPVTVTVGNIKRLCQQLFGLEVSKQRLFAQSASDADAWAAEPMADDLKPLSYYLGDAGSSSVSASGAAVDILMQEADEAVAQAEAAEVEMRRRAAEERQAAALAGSEARRQAQLADIQTSKLAAAAAAAAAGASSASAQGK